MRNFFVFVGIVGLLAWYYWGSPRDPRPVAQLAAPALAKQADAAETRKPVSTPAISSTSTAPTPAPESDTASPQSEINPLLKCFHTWGSGSKNHQEFIGRAGPVVRELVGDWFFSHRDHGEEFQQIHETSPAGRLYLGMAKAGLYGEQITAIEVNYEEARDLFASVANEFPENSAPILYGLAAAINANDKIAVKYWQRRLKKTKYFDSYYGQIQKAVLAQVRSPEDLASATYMLAAMPMPRYMETVGGILSKKSNIKIARQIASVAKDPDLTPDLDYSLLEYITAHDALKDTADFEKLPSFRDLFHAMNEPGSVASGALLKELEKNCDPQELNTKLRTLQAKKLDF